MRQRRNDGKRFDYGTGLFSRLTRETRRGNVASKDWLVGDRPESDNMTPDEIRLMRGASYLLPDPGGEVVRELLDEIERLQAELANARLHGRETAGKVG